MKYGLGEVTFSLRQKLAIRPNNISEPVHLNGLRRPQRLRLALQELGPTFIKLGQLLSTRPDLLGPDYIEELEKLQDQVAPETFESIRAEVESQLGKPLEQCFRWFDPAPIAAASIAQVHKAVTLEGDTVAVKIRRPRLVDIIRAECEILEGVASLIAGLLSEDSTIDPPQLAREFTEAVQAEAHMTQELRNIQEFARNFAWDPAVRIPKTYDAYCTDGVLTMEFIDGVKPSSIQVLDAAGMDRKELARHGANFTLRQVFDFGFFHTDPHPGNLFVLPGNILAPLDFGQVARLTPSDRAMLADLILAIVDMDASRLLRSFINADMLDSRTNTLRLTRDMEKLLQVYHSLPLKDIPFGRMMAQTFELIRHHRVRPPSEFTLMVKSMMTIETLARSLDEEFNLLEHLRPYAVKLNLEQMSPKRMYQGLRRATRDATALVSKLPDDINTILDKFKLGKFQMHVQHEHLDALERTLDKSSNRISFSLIIAGLLIASSFLVPQQGHVLGIISLQALGVLGYLVAAVMGIWLLWAILRSRHL